MSYQQEYTRWLSLANDPEIKAELSSSSIRYELFASGLTVIHVMPAALSAYAVNVQDPPSYSVSESGLLVIRIELTAGVGKGVGVIVCTGKGVGVGVGAGVMTGAGVETIVTTLAKSAGSPSCSFVPSSAPANCIAGGAPVVPIPALSGAR